MLAPQIKQSGEEMGLQIGQKKQVDILREEKMGISKVSPTEHNQG